jgi:hypothetical protein
MMQDLNLRSTRTKSRARIVVEGEEREHVFDL